MLHKRVFDLGPMPVDCRCMSGQHRLFAAKIAVYAGIESTRLHGLAASGMRGQFVYCKLDRNRSVR